MDHDNLKVKLKLSKIKIKNSFHAIKGQANTHLILKNKLSKSRTCLIELCQKKCPSDLFFKKSA